MPQFELKKRNIVTGVTTTIHTEVDPAGSAGAFDTEHYILATGAL